jgi:hypothetical protein
MSDSTQEHLRQVVLEARASGHHKGAFALLRGKFHKCWGSIAAIGPFVDFL